MPDSSVKPRTTRRILAFTKGVGIVQGVLVVVAGTILFGWPSDTDRLFAWTIASPATASFMGASYLSAILLQGYSLRGRCWEERRVAVPAVFVFSALTLVATVVHRDVFHFDSDELVARVFAWTWLAVYILVPLSLAASWLLQQRVLVDGSSARVALPAWQRIGALLLGAVIAVVGVLVFLAGSGATDYWPWSLSDLTAKVVGAWLVGVGLLLAHGALENDVISSRPAFASLSAAAVLYAATLLRHSGDVSWDGPPAWLYLGAAAGIAALAVPGVLGVAGARPQRSPTA